LAGNLLKNSWIDLTRTWIERIHMAKKRRQSTGKDLLTADITADMVRIDDFMSAVLSNQDTWAEFRRDPNGVCVKFGIHPPTTPDVNDRANAVFYATLSNKKLCTFIYEHYRSLRATARESQTYLTALKNRRIKNDTSLDVRAADHLLRDREALTTVFTLSLLDLNDRRILKKQYTKKELDEYIASYVDAVLARKPISKLPRLEEWDRNYGVGNEFGAMIGEVGPVLTVAIAVELAAIATVFVQMIPTPDSAELFEASISGDESATATLLSLSRLYQFSAELASHVATFER
jgi:hypothetical protein